MSLTELALAMRQSSLVGKWMEGVVETMHRGDTIVPPQRGSNLFRCSSVGRVDDC